MTLSPAALAPFLQSVAVDAICVSTEPNQRQLVDALRAVLENPRGPLADIVVHVRPHADAPAFVPGRLPVPLSPDLLLAVEGGAPLGSPARVELLARLLLGLRNPDAVALSAAVFAHPLIAGLVRHTGWTPCAWPDLLDALLVDYPFLGSFSRPAVWSLCMAFLELAGAVRCEGDQCAFQIALEWRVHGLATLLRRLPRAADSDAVAGADGEAPSAPAMVCRTCGLDGIGVVFQNGRRDTSAGSVTRAFRMGSPGRRFYASVGGRREVGPPCPVCGDNSSISPVGAPAPALFAWLTIGATFTANCPIPSIPPGLGPAISRMDLRLAVRDAVTDNPSRLTDVLDRVVAVIREGPPTALQAARDGALRWGAQSELTVGARRGASLQRLGLVVVAPERAAIDRIAPARQRDAVRVALALLSAGAVFHASLEGFLTSGGNAALLPCPVGDSPAPPEALVEGAGALWNRLEAALDESPHALSDLLADLRAARVLVWAPGGSGQMWAPEAVMVARFGTTLGCASNHRGFDVTDDLVDLLVNSPCPVRGCGLPLVPRPRPYGAMARWLESAERLPWTVAENVGPAWSVEGPAGRLTVRIEG